ncbi:MAG: helix-hairpin-helix domain-containing protein [Cyanobacteriota bacterium]|jgi:DNA uptake protein ComE-like DNA-binding protein
MFNLRRQALRRRLLSEPFCRFRNLEEVALAAQLGARILVNEASVDDWLRLPGFSIHQARQLTALTQGGVQFLCLEDLAAALGLPEHRLDPYAPILFFTYRDPESSLAPRRIPVNSASEAQLLALPCLTPALAEALFQERQRGGAFADLADLQRRLGWDGELLSRAMYYLQF